MREYEEEEEINYEEEDLDFRYDEMRDDFLMVNDVESAEYCIRSYGTALALYLLPEQYTYLIKEYKEDDDN